MRKIGTLPDSQQATTFQDYLLTQDIKIRVDQADGEWVVWVYDEDHVDESRELLDEFQSDPGAARFREAANQAEKIRAAERKKAEQARKNVVDVKQRWQRPAAASAPVTLILIGISVVVAAAASNWDDLWTLCDQYEPIVKALVIAPYEIRGNRIAWNHLDAIAGGQVWRLVTPIFLHFSIIHILFNMLWLRDLGAAIEARRGSLRFTVLVLVLAVSSNLTQYWMQSPMFGGMSGVVYGLFGYVWMKSRFEPQLGLFLHPQIVFWMIAWFVICLLGVVGNIANWAHGAGLVVGMAIGYAPKLWRDISSG